MPTNAEKIKELQAKRAKIVADARAIKDRADKDSKGQRDLTAEEASQIDTLLKDEREIKTQIDGFERDEKRMSQLAAAEAELEESRGRQTDPSDPRGSENPQRRGGRDAEGDSPAELRWRSRGGQNRCIRFGRKHDTSVYQRGFELYLKSGRASAEIARLGQAGRDSGEDPEERNLQADSFADGGALLAPTQMVAGLIKNVDDDVVIRQYATVHPLTQAQNLGGVSLEADASEGDWTSELGAPTDDTSMKFGRRELNPTPLVKSIKLSRKLIRLSPDVQALVQDRFRYKFGVTQEKQFLLGDGANKPLGVMVASSSGVSTGRDVSTGNSTTEIKADNLIRCKYALKQQYRRKARWMFHRDGVTMIALLKDGNGQYIWRQGLVAGEPDTLLSLPIDESEFFPNTFTTGKYVGLLACWEHYWIAEALQLEIQVLDQTSARQNQIEYLARMELDAMPVLEEAFVRCKLG